ncbi:hypothetical protein ACWGLC_10085 [Dietzia sp. NPDC055877]
MSLNRVFGSRVTRLGVAFAAMTLTIVGVPAIAHADTEAGALSVEQIGQGSGEGSVDKLIEQVPDEIVVGGPALGSAGLEAAGSGELVGTALSVGQTLGSVAPLEAVGSAGGSAVASVASSGLVPGSTYVNAVGSLGSGTIGLGSVVIPEYVFPVLSVQVAGIVTAEMGARQERGELNEGELNFWHGVVEGSAQGGTMIEDAANAAGAELPGPLTGSIDAVQIAAESDPHADNERRRVEAEAAAAAAEANGAAEG